MKLYYAPGTCSLASHIVAREARLPVELVRVDLGTRRTELGSDYRSINRRGYVPALELPDGSIATEGAVLLQILGEMAEGSGLLPSRSKERLDVLQWVSYVATELHQCFSPWLLRSEVPAEAKAFALSKLKRSLADLDLQLQDRAYLTGDAFTIADAYAFVVVRWVDRVDLDLARYPHVAGFLARVAARPLVQRAIEFEATSA